MRPRFEVTSGVGTKFRTTNGIPQGCLPSIILLNLLVSVWSRVVEHEAGVQLNAHARDSGVAAPVAGIAKAGLLTPSNAIVLRPWCTQISLGPPTQQPQTSSISSYARRSGQLPFPFNLRGCHSVLCYCFLGHPGHSTNIYGS